MSWQLDELAGEVDYTEGGWLAKSITINRN